MADLPRVDITKPKWDQSHYIGRAKHFFLMTNPLNIFASPKQLNKAKDIVDKYKAGKPLPQGTSIDDVWKAKYLYDSAYHPDTGEKMILIGRMSAQMPMNTIITGAMMTFYKTNTAVIFWQWMNQTFNAIVNYTNRSGDSPIPVSQLGTSYVLATFGALTTALYLNRQVTRLPPIFGRWVPFAAVAAANCINIPCMRLSVNALHRYAMAVSPLKWLLQKSTSRLIRANFTSQNFIKRELREGVHIVDNNNNRLGSSCKAAREGIAQVIVSRIFMCTPSMFLTPMVVEKLDQRGLFKTYPKGPIAVNLAMCALCLTFATPLCCALFTQQVAVNISRLEQPIQEAVKKLNPSPQIGYYNKGL